jgi:hypothetical protein
MDIKEKIEEIVNKVKNDKDFASSFKKDPVAAVEGILGVDLPDDQVKAVIEGVKAKIGTNKISGILGGLFGKK